MKIKSTFLAVMTALLAVIAIAYADTVVTPSTAASVAANGTGHVAIPAASAPNSEPDTELNLTQKGNRLYAYVVLKSSVDMPQSTIQIQWDSPDGSGCMSSSYPLTYRGKLYHTNAYRTVIYSLPSGKVRVCAGEWKVTVVDAQGNQLTSGTFTVEAMPSNATASGAMTSAPAPAASAS